MQNRVLLILIIFFSFVFPTFARGAGARDSKTGGTEGGLTALPSPGSAAAYSGAEKIEAFFFYEELCGLCHEDETTFASILKDKLPLAERDQYPNIFRSINIYNTSGREEYKQISDELGLDRGALETPFMILGGRVFQGYDSIRTNIREAYLTAAEDLYVYRRPYNPLTKKTGAQLFDDYPVDPDHVTMVYFYRVTCPECAKATPIVDALPKTVSVNGKTRTLDIIRINTRSGNNGERIAAFFEAWQVPDKDRMVPIVFFSDSYLAGIDAISSKVHEGLSGPPQTWKLLPERR